MTRDVDADWRSVENEISRLLAQSGAAFAPAALASIADFFELARRRCPVAEVASGYWRNSMRFCWNAVSFEVEVFEDHIELYRFYDRRSEIRHVPHNPGGTFPNDVVKELPTVPKA